MNLLTPKTAAERFNKSPKTLREWFSLGIITGFRIRGRIYFEERDIARVIQTARR